MKLETSSNMNMRSDTLVLGKGYIGTAIQKYLGCDIKSSKELEYHNPQLLRKYLLNNDIQHVVNCSGFTGRPNIDEAETKKELCYYLNVISPLAINRLCDELGIRYVHISSGCIYEGYQTMWSEHDTPNFGLYQNHSSFYSKSKHAFEIHSESLNGIILRIRMPLDSDVSHRNYLHKIRNYNNLINFTNSKTYIQDLCAVVDNVCDVNFRTKGREIVNVINPEPLSTMEVCEIMKKYGFENNNWKFVDISKLEIIAGRSNCVMDSSKVMRIHQMKTETEALEEIFQKKLEKINKYNTIYD